MGFTVLGDERPLTFCGYLFKVAFFATWITFVLGNNRCQTGDLHEKREESCRRAVFVKAYAKAASHRSGLFADDLGKNSPIGGA